MKIYARNCDIVDFTKEDKNTVKIFLGENHSQGNARFSVAYGLKYKDELVQILTFGKPRFDKTVSWELIRDCTKKNYEVIGGLSKLWGHFLKSNNVRSCVVYTYPHNGGNLFANKYIDFCGFYNIDKARPTKKTYFEGIWNGEPKRIDKSILEIHGVDRLLNGDFGQDRTNEQILLDLGFEKKEEDGYSSQKDIYFPFGVLYKITDTVTGNFYIGKCENEDKWNNGYTGSGSRWLRYKESHKDEINLVREILRDDFKSPKELLEAEVNEIRKYCSTDENGKLYISNEKCYNVCAFEQGTRSACLECGGFLSHKKSCSQYKEPTPCSECGGIYHHYKSCSQYKPLEPCPECGGMRSHKKTCSKYKEPAPCPECGKKYGHKKSCSQYSYNSEKCPECGMDRKRHKKTCSHYVVPEGCPECGKVYGHKKSCSQYKAPDPCPECGGLYGHKKTCSQYIDYSNPCPECGSRTKHKPGCSHYKLEICPECGGKNNHHKNTCSKYNVAQIVCSECGGIEVKHRKGCSKYIGAKECPECGSSRGHKKTCSKYVAPPPCPECGAIKGHLSSCSKAKKCLECGCAHGHNSSCSHYKPKLPCPECGSRGAHKPSCSRSYKNK